MKVAKGLVLITAVLFSASAAEASPLVFIVRHAEKMPNGGNDPDLSSAGRNRAEALGRVFKDAELSAIFTTEFKRTQQTAAPIVKATQISSTIVYAADNPALIEKLRGLKGNALVIGHSNTIPELITALGIETAVNIPDDDYNELFVITMCEKPQLVRLHYPL